MKPPGSFSKRVKRHVVGPVHDFFAATAPYLERLCRNELKNLGRPPEDLRLVPGGVEFKGRLPECYAANLFIRTPSRILMRIAEFKVTNFRQLEKKLLQVPWELYLNPRVKSDYHIKTAKSRLYHKTAVADQFDRCIANRLAPPLEALKSATDNTLRQRIFIRAIEDRFTVSLDSSGDLLYKRGLKRHTGRAPIRETIAAAILILSGYTGKEPLVDPMCGSGTFSLEATMMAKHIPPGWYRTFVFMAWPAFGQKQWAHLKKVYSRQIRRIEKPIVFASDQDLSMCRMLEDISRKFQFSETIQVLNKDFFKWTPAEVTSKKGLVVLNPPFGVRLKKDSISGAYYNEIIAKLKSDYRGWRLALLLPEAYSAKGLPGNFSAFPLYHGGLKLSLLVGRLL